MMERFLKNNPELTPTRLATQAQYYAKMDPRMRPLLITLAQRVKTKVRVRALRDHRRTTQLE
jgi:hypothetical protein